MDHAHEELVKVVEEGGGNFFLQSIAKTCWVWRDVCIDEGEGSFPSGLVVQCLRSLEVFEAEADVVGGTSIAVVFFVMLC